MGEDRLLAIDIQTAAGGPLEPASVYPPASAPQGGKMQPLAARQVARDKDMDAHQHDARPSVEAQIAQDASPKWDFFEHRLRRLDALHEELCRLNQQIEEAEH